MSNDPVHLVCPGDSAALMREGQALVCPVCGATYPVCNEIPRFVGKIADDGQEQVANAFAYKWTRDEWGYKPEHIQLVRDFFWKRFGFSCDADVSRTFGDRVVLHAGIGSGQAEQHYLPHCREVWGADISRSVDACLRNWNAHYPALAAKLHLVQADLMALPFADGSFDIVFSDGVLHHTPDTFKALAAVVPKVRSEGLVVFYVYRRKGPIREFVDDYLRSRICGLSPQEAWQKLEPLTALARDLSRQRIRIKVPEPVESLGLPAGEHDLQRWLYWNVMKFYWNEALTFDENNHVNFDWYYPTYAWRQTPEEVQAWLRELKLVPVHFRVGDSGISVIARRG